MRSVVVVGLLIVGCVSGQTGKSTNDATSVSNIACAGNDIGAVGTTKEVSGEIGEAVSTCPVGMRLVEGEYCGSIKADCINWIDPPDAAARRCKEYAPTKCLVPTIHRKFCMAITEYTEGMFATLQASSHRVKSVNQTTDLNSRLPLGGIDYWQAKDICEAQGQRMCKESEFLQACSGPEYNPYPTGLVRRCDLCNCDVSVNIGTWQHRVDHRKTVDEVMGCMSGYGISGLVGNIDEQWTRDVSPGKYGVVEKGGHFLPVRNRCVDATTNAHSELYSSEFTLGMRCCRDVP